MSTIDSRIVQLTLDNAQFQRGVQSSLISINDLKKGLNFGSLSVGLTTLSNAAKSFTMSGMAASVDTVSSRFGALEMIGFTVLQNLTNSAMNFGKSMVDSLALDPMRKGFGEYETQMGAVQTIMANTASKGTTLRDVNGALDELNTYADKTIYNFTEMTRNIGTFTAAGVDLKTSTAAIKGIGNLAAVSGSNSQQASTAMYQLSQALASGSVKLQDWNSVVNAGMGGEIFQTALKETAKVHGVNVEQMIKDEGSFRETLKSGWITTAVLTETLSKFTGDLSAEQLKAIGYTEEQITGIQKLGIMSNDAATKVKTFSQLLETLAEANQSGWAASSRIVVGDFEEAKKLFTEISGILGGIIGASAESRNNVLKGWADLGGREVLISSLRNSFEGLMGILTPIGKAFSRIFPPLTATNLFNVVWALDDLSKKFKMGEGTATSLEASALSLFRIFALLKESFLEIFPPITIEQFWDLSKGLRDLIFNFRLGQRTANNLGRTFKGVAAIIDIFVMLVSAVGKGLGRLISYLSPTAGGIFGVTAELGDFILGLRASIKETDFFNKMVDNVAIFLGNARDAILNFSQIAGEKFARIKLFFEPILATIKDFSSRIWEFLKANGIFLTIIGTLQEFGKTVSEAFASIKEVDLSGIGGLAERIKARFAPLSKIGDFIKERFGGIWGEILKFLLPTSLGAQVKKATASSPNPANDIIANIWKWIVDGIKKIDFSKFDFNVAFDSLNAGLLTTFLLTINNFVNKGSGIFGGITDIFKAAKDVVAESKGTVASVKELLDGVKQSLEAYQQSLRAGILLKIAGAIGILALSLIALTLVDSEKLAIALAAVTSLFADLFGFIAGTDKVVGAKGIPAMEAVVVGMIGLSVALLILSASVKVLAKLKPEELTQGILGIMTLTATLTAASLILSKNSGNMIKGAFGLTIFALALKMIIGPVREVGEMDQGNLLQGLIGVGVMIGELVFFMSAIKISNATLGNALMMIFLATSIQILASSVQLFAKMSPDELMQGLAAIGAMLVEIAIFSRLAGGKENTLMASFGIFLLADAMFIFGKVLKEMGSMSWDEITHGLVAMGGSLAILTIALNLLPKDMGLSGVNIYIVASALVILADALNVMGDMSWDEVGRGLAVLAGSMGILVLALYGMQGALPGAAALIIAAVALNMLAPALKALGSIPIEQIGIALLALAGVFVIMGLAGLLLGPMIPVLISLAGVMVIFGLAAALVGAGVLIFSMGMASLALTGVAGVTAITGIVIGVLGLIGVLVTGIVAGIVQFVKLIAEAAPEILKALVATLLVLVDAIVQVTPALLDALTLLLLELIDLITDVVPVFIDAVLYLIETTLQSIADRTPAFIQAGFDIIMAFLKGIRDNIGGIVTVVADIIIAFNDALALKIPELVDSGFKLIIAFLDGLSAGIDENMPALIVSVGKVVDAIVNALVSGLTASTDYLATETGKLSSAIVNSLIQGLLDAAQAIADAVGGLASEALDALRAMLGIPGPSESSSFQSLGRGAGGDFAEGIGDKANSVRSAANRVGNAAISGLSTAIGRMSEALTTNFDTSPTIRPVLDLTEIIAGSTQIDSLLTPPPLSLQTANKSVSRVLNGMGSSGEQEQEPPINQSGQNGTNVSFTQNIYSPTAVSRLDIYRATKNQLLVLKGKGLIGNT